MFYFDIYINSDFSIKVSIIEVLYEFVFILVGGFIGREIYKLLVNIYSIFMLFIRECNVF